MNDQPRVPMPRPFFAPGDVAVSASPDMRVGRRFNFDVSEELLARIGGEALKHAVAKMGEHVAMAHRQEIERVVYDYFLANYAANRDWFEPIIREVVRDSIREFLAEWAKDEAQRLAFWTVLAAINEQNRDDSAEPDAHHPEQQKSNPEAP